jgi:hypothetical protein
MSRFNASSAGISGISEGYFRRRTTTKFDATKSFGLQPPSLPPARLLLFSQGGSSCDPERPRNNLPSLCVHTGERT